MKSKERIPLHDHRDFNSGGRIDRAQITTVVSAAAPVAPSAPGGGAGGSETPVDHGSMGSTETIDAGDGTWHRGTLSADCTITVTGFTVDEGLVVLVKIAQDGTGGWAITWDVDVVFAGNDQPGQAAGAVTWFLLWSDEGDPTIYGATVGGGASTRWELAVVPGSPPDPLYADGDYLYIEVPI